MSNCGPEVRSSKRDFFLRAAPPPAVIAVMSWPSGFSARCDPPRSSGANRRAGRTVLLDAMLRSRQTHTADADPSINGGSAWPAFCRMPVAAEVDGRKEADRPAVIGRFGLGADGFFSRHPLGDRAKCAGGSAGFGIAFYFIRPAPSWRTNPIPVTRRSFAEVDDAAGWKRRAPAVARKISIGRAEFVRDRSRTKELYRGRGGDPLAPW